MDSLTQIVLGAAVGEAVAGKEMGNKAAAWGAIAGTIPDLDVFFRAMSNSIDGALLHRGFSHSIVFAILISPVLAWIVQKLYRDRYSFKLLFWLFFLAVFTHPLLDIFTNYGTQLLWPFDLRITFNSVFVIDPLYTVPFGICLLIALFLKRTNPRRRLINRIGLIMSSAYLLWCSTVKVIILNQSESYFQSAGIDGSNNLVTPMPFTSFYWMMVTEDKDNFYVGYKSIFYPFDKNDVEELPKNHALLDSAKWSDNNYADKLKFISNGYYTMQEQGDTLLCYDLRFGLSTKATNGIVRTPMKGYGMVIDNGFVNKTVSLRPDGLWNHLNFDSYLNEVFWNE